VTSAPKTRRLAHIDYRWIALSNTTLGVFMAGLNGSVVLIALPAIFRGIGVNPLAPGESNYLLWTLVGYTLVTAVLLVSAGRVSDIYGRVRLYNAGFAVFTLGSILCFFVQGQGDSAAVQLIAFRIIQGIGSAFLFANSAAILTDAFPHNQRGLAMGMNQIGMLAGSFGGLLVGGLLATVDWRAVFLVSVPFGLLGTVWAYLMLHETATIRAHQKLDIPGNVLFALGLTLVLVGFTYAIQPFGSDSMGWGNPSVLGEIVGGLVLLGVFMFVERRMPDPMFRLELFKIRMFAAGNVAGFLSSLARGGLQLILIVWLQGIWLPLHGYSFEDAPLWAAIYMLPMTVGFLLAGPLSGRLSDRYGARYFSTGGMLITAAAFAGFLMLPADFDYPAFASLLLMLGLGMGAFAAPNTASIMNAVPPEHRGAASGMRATFQNVASSLSLTLIFTLVVAGLSRSLPGSLYSHMTAAGVPSGVATQVSGVPPVGALFAAFLGYNPMATLIPGSVLSALPAAAQTTILGNSFFPQLLSGPFHDGLSIAFTVCVVLSLGAAAASWLRGPRYIHGIEDGGASEIAADEVESPGGI
jgi:MFS family permease